SHPRACGVLASILLSTGRADEAVPVLAQCVEANPQDLGMLSLLCSTLNYASSARAEGVAARHLEYGRKVGAAFSPSGRRHANSAEPERVLRVGFVGADFRAHASMHFIEPAIEHLDRRGFEVFIYHSHPSEDAVSSRLRGYTSVRWLNAAGL